MKPFSPPSGGRANRLAGLFAAATVVLFAGAGGACIGIEQAYVDAGFADKYIDLAVNHWDVAVGVHELNHPMTEHRRGDVREIDPLSVLMGRHIAYLHLSPDCTDFSKAKGSKPKRKHIRGLAWVGVDWAAKRRPDVITLENVEEFAQWGPLGRDGQPCKRRRGSTFKRWVKALESLGYKVEWRELRAHHIGVPTTRKRLFIIARCDGKPIIWPEQTHGPNANETGVRRTQVQTRRANSGLEVEDGELSRRPQFDREVRINDGRDEILAGGNGEQHGQGAKGRSREEGLKPFRTAAECIDWSIPMLSIFATPAEAKAWAESVNVGKPKHDRIGVPRRPLKEKTLQRIARGLVKWVIESKRPFIVRLAHGDHCDGKSRWGHSSHSIDQPLGSVTGSKDFAAVDVSIAPFVSTLNHGGEEHRSASVETPLATVTGANDARALVAAMITKFRGDSAGHPASDPMPTITSGAGSVRDAGAAHAMAVSVAYLSHLYGTNKGGNGDVDKPLSTITGSSNHSAVVAVELSEDYSCDVSAQKTASHASTIYAEVAERASAAAGTCSTPAIDADKSSATISTSNATAHLTSQNIERTSTTTTNDRRAIVAAFLAAYYGDGSGKIGHDISKPMPTVVSKDRIGLVTVVIDNQTYVITDIAMRMLTPRELLLAQGFPPDYRVDVMADGTRVSKADQVKLIGNAVPPEFLRRIAADNVVAQGVLDDAREAVPA